MDKIICVGKNYPAHAAELGEAQPERPVLFIKPPSALCQLPQPEMTPVSIALPAGEVHHELEIVLKIAPPESPQRFSAFTLGLDLTRRDLQTNLKKAGQPWEIAKVFANSAIVNQWHPFPTWGQMVKEPFSLKVNGAIRQSGRATEMLWPMDACLDLAKSYFPICAGDLLFTGTPQGVGPIKSGDLLEFSWGSSPWSSLKIQ